jgi:hypothetical protein
MSSDDKSQAEPFSEKNSSLHVNHSEEKNPFENTSSKNVETSSHADSDITSTHKSSPEKINPESPDESSQKTENEIDDELLIEQDGDFFWILQKVVWSIVKVLVGLGIVIFLIWIIWDTDENPLTEKINIQEKKESLEKTVEKTKKTLKESLSKKEEKTATSSPIITPQSSSAPFVFKENESVITMAQWHQWIEKTRTFQQKEVISRSLDWLDQAEEFFSFPIKQIFVGKTSVQRSKKINQVLTEIRSLLQKSDALRRDMVRQIQGYNPTLLEEKKVYNFRKQELEEVFKSARKKYSDSLLHEKIQAQQNITELSSLLEIRHRLIRQMEQYDKSLRISYENIVANQEALIQNIQVVEFPGDATNRILTPTEWRSIQKTKQ